MADASWVAVVVALLGSGAAVEFIRRRFPSRDREADSADKRRDVDEARYQRFNEAAERFREELRHEMDALRLRHEKCEEQLQRALEEQGILFVQIHKVEAALEILKERDKRSRETSD